MKYISVCSGIEAATVAWHGLGWEPVAFAEIEPFPSAVLAHHYPDVPNLGDMTAFKEWQVDAFDVLVGGTPCQAFSVAGLRQSLDDARGNLSLIFCEMADHFNPPYILWENVPGVLNTKDNAFGCFLAGLAGEDVPLVAPGGKWTDAGFVLGPKRAVAWRILDAQYFGLAQRRRRVFVVACPRDGADPRAILFEREGVRRDSPPSREKGQDASANLESRSGAGGFPGTDGACGGHVVPVAPTLRAGGNSTGGDRPYGTDVDTADSLIPVQCITGPITHALKADGFDGSEDGTGRGQPIVCQEVADTITNCFHKHHVASGGKDCLPRNHVLAFGISNQPTPKFAEDVCPSLDAKVSGGGRMECVAFAQNQLGEVREGAVVNTLDTNSNACGRNTPMVAQSGMTGKGDLAPCICIKGVAIGRAPEAGPQYGETLDDISYTQNCTEVHGVMTQSLQVRRLLPEECESLQGFPRNYTRIPWRKKPAEDCPDGPRYKALGNSMAVPVIRWIGWRIGLTKRNP